MICPTCNTPVTSRHCAPNAQQNSPTCDLIRCGTCKGYGTKDGRLWANAR